MEKYSPQDRSDQSSTEFFFKERLGTDSADESEEDIQLLNYKNQSWFRSRTFFTVFHVVLIALNIIFCLTYTNWTTSRYAHGPQHQFSPARDVIEYIERKFELLRIYMPDGSLNQQKPSHFNGDPRPELKEAWGNLTQYQNIRLQENELGEFRGDNSVVKLSDGSGYFATLAAYHGLHCVERLHHYIHKDFYYEGISVNDSRRLKHHTEHCLDWLRQYVQCNADTTPILLHWGSDDAFPQAKDIGGHQCVKWDKLDSWMSQRTFNAFEPGLLMHPKFGSPYGKDMKGDNIGIGD